MSTFDASPFLRRILLADGVISGATGALMAAGAGTLEEVLGVPAALLRFAGFVLVPFAILVVSLARQEALTRSSVLAIIGMNAAWVAASAAALLFGWIQPNGLGYAFVIGQAAAVAVLAEMQYVGLRNVSALPA